jgi:hypothetical protein
MARVGCVAVKRDSIPSTFRAAKRIDGVRNRRSRSTISPLSWHNPFSQDGSSPFIGSWPPLPGPINASLFTRFSSMRATGSEGIPFDVTPQTCECHRRRGRPHRQNLCLLTPLGRHLEQTRLRESVVDKGTCHRSIRMLRSRRSVSSGPVRRRFSAPSRSGIGRPDRKYKDRRATSAESYRLVAGGFVMRCGLPPSAATT